MIAWLLAMALAGEPDEPHVSEEITVWAEHRVQQAREIVLQDLQALGFTDIEREDGYYRLQHAQAWKGEVHLYDDGWMIVRRQKARAEAPEFLGARENTPVAWLGCAVHPLQCVQLGGVMVSRRKFMAQKVRTVSALERDVQRYADAVADRETERRVDDLPDRLERLWSDGEPLEEGPTLATVAERKAAILDFWESRTDTVWGDRVRVTVEAFLRGEVQYSDHPFTAEEIEVFNARRTCRRALDLDSPWGEVTADVDLTLR